MMAADGSTSSPRQALKAAIIARAAAADRLESTKAGLDRIGDELFSAQRRLREARTAAADTQALLVRQIVAGGSSSSALLERAGGKSSEDALAAEIVALEAAKELMRTEWRESEGGYDLAQRRAKSAVLSVLALGAPQCSERQRRRRSVLSA
jgi:hypothetical protein